MCARTTLFPTTAGVAEAATGVGVLAVLETEAVAGLMKGVAAIGKEFYRD